MTGRLRGCTTAYLCYWDEVYDWIHVSEIKKLREAYERFKRNKHDNR